MDKISKEDCIKLINLKHELKHIRVYYGKNKTKKRRCEQKLFKNQCVINRMNAIIFPYAKKIWDKNITDSIKNEISSFANIKDINIGDDC